MNSNTHRRMLMFTYFRYIPLVHAFGCCFLCFVFWRFQVNFKVKRSNWDGTGDEQKEEEEKKDEEVWEGFTALVYS